MLKPESNPVNDLIDFLPCRTPRAWLDAACANLPLLLIDHAHCERKAAATAINFISKYPEKEALIEVMSPLAREELLHFEKVITLMKERGINFGPLTPSDYAVTMHRQITKSDGKERLRDQLIVGAIIEARSCERFHALIEVLDDVVLKKFYRSLVKSEARHFQDYLRLAKEYAGDIDDRLTYFLNLEFKLINSEDPLFRFHSGIPTGA